MAAAMAMCHSLAMPDAAEAVERAVDDVIDAGLRTPDIAAGGASVSTEDMGSAVADRVRANRLDS